MKNVSLKNTIAKGFSLVEMLVVIAVIGVIAAIAIPNIGSINASAKDAKNQRNAQSVVSVYSAATAAGAEITGDKKARLTSLVNGVKITGGAFDGKFFKVPGITSTEDIDGTLEYIEVDAQTGDLVYKKDGVATTP